jgi:glutathione S-transferase
VEPIAIVIAAALGQYVFFSYQVSRSRIKHGVRAPATTGHPEFDRVFRVHQNTLEQLIIFIPALWLFGLYVHPLTGAAIALLFPVGRHIYYRSYVSDPSRRTAGVAIGGIATLVLLIGALVGATLSWI